MYFEQCYVTSDPHTNEDFICAIALCKMTAVNIDVNKMMLKLFGIDKVEVDAQVNVFSVVFTYVSRTLCL